MKEDRLTVSALMTMNKNMFNVILDNFTVFTKKKATVWQVVVKTVKFIFNQRANRWSDSLKVGTNDPHTQEGTKRRHKQLSRSGPAGYEKQNTGPNHSKQIESLGRRIGAAGLEQELLPSWALDG